MAAANFSRDVIEMFYGPIEESQRLRLPISPNIRGEFEIVRNNFNDWLRVWKMRATKNNKDLFKFFQSTKNSFMNVCKNEVENMNSVKIQFSLLVRFYMMRDEKKEEMYHHFNRMQPVILNEHNVDILNNLLNQFIDEVKGEIEAWSERASGWIMDKISEAFINVARYQPMRGGSYMPLPKKLQNKKAIINVQNRDNCCLRWAIRAALFPAPRGANVARTSSYPTSQEKYGLELLTDLDMHLFIERGMRGGISMASKRYAKANNPRVEGYDPTQPTNYITYLDANNLYGWAMSQPLPKKNFHWKRVMPTEEQIMKMKWNSKKGWILEVDIEYPAELHDAHNDYPLAPEKKAIKPEQMSGYQRRLMNDLDIAMPNTEKLVLTLEDKEKYVTHYKNL